MTAATASEATLTGALTSQLSSSTTINTFTLPKTTTHSGADWRVPFVYVCFAIGAVIIVLGVALIVFFVIRHRRRRRDMVIARQRLHHLQQYHTKGNPVGNGLVADELHPTAVRSSPSDSHQSTLTTVSVVLAHNLPDNATSGDQYREYEMDDKQHQRRSHINGDVFYVSGRANTARCTTANDLGDHTLTTFKYLTYDCDYFHERQKSTCLQDRNLRHSME